jgi:D-glycero-alpha-D-manno-heptose-7-phosphate kinase
MSPPAASVRATAPVRIADVGGWTDTWFGAPGRVCNVAVGPGVTVDASVIPRPGGGPVLLRAPGVALDTVVDPGAASTDAPAAAALLIHAVGAVLDDVTLPADLGVEVRVHSEVPPGASVGTSATVLVAVVAALDALLAHGRHSPADVAALAHLVETGRAGREAGVQDHWAAAMGGVGLLVVDPYPRVEHRSVTVPPDALAELRRRTVTVSVGHHDSSAVHRRVIGALTAGGPGRPPRREPGDHPALARLAHLADDAAAALAAGDLDEWAEVLVRSVDAQAALHHELVGARHRAVIATARRLGAVGWKVNGAGGEGGSVTVVLGDGPTAATADELAGAVAALDATWTLLALEPSAGLRVVVGPAEEHGGSGVA